MQKQVTQNSHTATTQYMGGYQYSNTRLQFFSTAEGYVKNTIIQGKNSYDYIYNLTDHLDNIRMSFGLDPKTQQLVKFEENNYYPYGLKHTNYNADINAYIAQGTTVVIGKIPISSPLIPINAYKYNGKELQEELSLNIYDMDFRDYDPATARWLGIDPITHFDQSSYMAMNGNPVFFADPSGADGVPINTWHYAGSNYSTSGGTGQLGNGDHMFGGSGDSFWMGQGALTWGGGSPISMTGNTININWSAFGDTRTVWNASTNVISRWIPGPGGVIYDGDPSVNRLDSAVVNGHWERSGGFDGYNYADGIGQLTNAATVVWGATQLGVNRLRQVNLASSVGEAFGIGTQIAAPRLQAFTNTLGTWGNRVGAAGVVLSATSIGVKLYTGNTVSTAEYVSAGIGAGLLVAGSIVAGTALATPLAVAALIYGAVELGSYAITGQSLEQHIFEP